MTSMTEHEGKRAGVHGITNVNDLWNNHDSVGRWQATGGATALGTVGVNALGMAAPNPSGTVTNGDDHSGPYVNYSTSTTLNNEAGIQSAALYRVAWQPIVTARLRSDALAQGQRVWVGLSSLTLGALLGSATPGSGHVAAFRVDNSGTGVANIFAVTGNNGVYTAVDTGVPWKAATVFSFSIEFEGVVNNAPKKIHFYINRVLVATISTTLPVSTGNNLILLAAIRNLLAGTARTLAVSRVTLSTQG